MALSNWATLAFDEAGQPCRGVLTGFDGAMIEIYKNGLDVRDHKMWTSGRFFEKPMVAQITDGHVILSEIQIEAIQHP